jgi:hypothetical protein
VRLKLNNQTRFEREQVIRWDPSSRSSRANGQTLSKISGRFNSIANDQRMIANWHRATGLEAQSELTAPYKIRSAEPA